MTPPWVLLNLSGWPKSYSDISLKLQSHHHFIIHFWRSKVIPIFNLCFQKCISSCFIWIMFCLPVIFPFGECHPSFYVVPGKATNHGTLALQSQCPIRTSLPDIWIYLNWSENTESLGFLTKLSHWRKAVPPLCYRRGNWDSEDWKSCLSSLIS